MAVTFTFFQCITEDLAEEKHNFDTDSFKLALTNSAPSVSSNTVYSDLSEITAGNGYTAGGMSMDLSTSRTTTTTTITGSEVTLTASGGSVSAFRYAVLYNASSLALVGYVDYGTSHTLSDGTGFIFRFGVSLFTITNS